MLCRCKYRRCQVRPSAPARFAELAAVAPLGRTLDPAIAGPIGRVGSVKPAVFPVDDETTIYCCIQFPSKTPF